MDRIRRALKTTAVAQMFNVIALIVSFVAIPYYLRWLGQERYGVFLTGVTFSGYLMLADMGLSWSAMILISQADGKDDRVEIGRIFRVSVTLSLCSSLVVAVVAGGAVLLMKAALLSDPSLMHPEAPGLIVAVACSAATTLIAAPVYVLFSGLQQGHISHFYSGVGRTLGTIAMVLVASTGVKLGWVFGASVAFNAVAALAAGVYCVIRFPWAFSAGRFWDRARVLQQLRTGAKSFGLHMGTVIGGSAPLLAISFGAGSQFVPLYSVPMTLLNAPLNIVSVFGASMQAGYGSALARGETRWIADTVARVVRHALLLTGLATTGFILLAQSFIWEWTRGQLAVPRAMVLSVVLVAVPAAILSTLRFALTGINRHRVAALTELLFGVLAFVACVSVVRRIGYEWVGIGTLFATIATIGWTLSIQLRRALGVAEGVFPGWSFFLKLGAGIVAALLGGYISLRLGSEWPAWRSMSLVFVVVSVIYILLVKLLFPRDWTDLLRMWR